MPDIQAKSSNLNIVVLALVAALAGAGCSSADLGASNTGQGTNPLNTSSTGGANTGTNTTVATGGSTSAAGTNAGAGGTATSATGGGPSNSAPTWTQLYNSYFGSGTSGSCTSCHGAGMQPSFSSASTMCSALKQVGYIQNGTASLQNLLTWFGKGGNMPQGGGATPPNAVADITAWQNAGAVCP